MDEQEKDKKVLEFWEEIKTQGVVMAIKKHVPKTPFNGKFAISANVTFAHYQFLEILCFSVGEKANIIEWIMFTQDFLTNDSKIVDIHVTMSVGDLPGIAFCMEEV